MLIQETTPQVRQFTLQQESTDPDYGSCLWMTVTLDLDKYAMMAQSDQGDYSHTWSRTPDRESFLELMCRVEQEYLTRKISTACVFNLDESKRQTLAVLYPSDVTRKLKKAICDLESPTEESFYRECGEILDEFKIEHDFETIQTVKDHPHGAIVFAQMFCDHLQPHLRAILKQEAHREQRVIRRKEPIMATYQTAVKHPDTTEKVPVDIANIKFLQTLQTIMNTQDDMGNADPRFWVIKGQKTVPTGDDYADGFQIIDSDGNAVADSAQSAILFMKQQIDDFGGSANLVMTCDETDPAEFTLVFTDKVSYKQSYALNSDSDMDEFVAIMNSYFAMCPDIENQTYRRVPVKITEFIYPDTLFITHEAAESHLKANAHHYDPTAHAYAMTAWRSPQIEQLWSLLRHADFDRLIKLVQEVT